ncbi:MAG: hypothetical protein ABFS03_12915 [Chloroflexota bacterium]
MKTADVKVVEIQNTGDGFTSIQIACPSSMVPVTGSYLGANLPGAVDSVLGVPLFPVGFSSLSVVNGSTLLNTLPSQFINVRPGSNLRIHGPLGRGFDVPDQTRHLALVAFGDTAARLLPLISPALILGAEIVLFAQNTPLGLPTAVEIHPLSALPDMIAWADFAAFDFPLAFLPELRSVLGLMPHEQLTYPAQALITSPMPCTAMAVCGVCAVPAKRGFKLACKDGPVLDLPDLRW